MSSIDYTEQLSAATTAALAGQTIIDQYYQQRFKVRTKADNTPVTEVDIAVEQEIKTHLMKAFPDYGFYGEESERVGSDAVCQWLVDPIDGTKSFVRHSPFFSTQIALMVEQRLVVGVSNAPAMRELAVACSGQPGRLNDQPLRCSDVEELSAAFLSSGNIGSLAADAGRWSRYAGLVQRVARVRGYGDFYHYHQLACGQADLVVESDVNILDIAALSVVVEQAGGVFTDLDGNPPTLETTSVLAAATPALHAAALALLQG